MEINKKAFQRVVQDPHADRDPRKLLYSEQLSPVTQGIESAGSAVPIAGVYGKVRDKKEADAIVRALRRDEGKEAARKLAPVAASPLDGAFRKP